MDIISTYQQVGSYRGTAAICGTSPKTIKRVVARAEAGGTAAPRVPRVRNYESVAGLVGEAAAAGGAGGGVHRVGAQLPPPGRGSEGRVAPPGPPWAAPSCVDPG
jgi:hypothetical protein